MRLKAVTGIMLTVLLIGMVTLAFNIQPVWSSEPPATEWNKTYGGTNNENLACIIQTSDGGYAMAGYTTSFGAGGYDAWLVKTDSAGNMQWNKTYGGVNDESGCNVVQTSDGGYVIVIDTASFGAGDRDFWLIKTDASGDMQWNKTYGGADMDAPGSVVQTSDGGYAIVGCTASFGPGTGAFWLIKTNSTGHVEWSKTYGATQWDRGLNLVQTSDGGYAIVGYSNSFGGGWNLWLVKTNSTGDMEWSQTYGGAGREYGGFVVQTSDGGNAIVVPTTSFGAGGFDFWLVKTDAAGNMLWSKTYGGTSDDEAWLVAQTSDGGYAIVGRTKSFGAGGSDGWLVKTDSAGNMQWNQTYGGTSSDVAYCVVETGDGGYALAGSTASFGSGGSDGWLVKVAGPPVGGIWVPVDKLGLLAPYIGVASTILVATVTTAIYAKRVKRREAKNT